MESFLEIYFYIRYIFIFVVLSLLRPFGHAPESRSATFYGSLYHSAIDNVCVTLFVTVLCIDVKCDKFFFLHDLPHSIKRFLNSFTMSKI